MSSGEAELNSAVKGISELIGVYGLCKEMNIPVNMKLGTDATVCKSILLRHGVGKIKHLSTRQLWVQGAIEAYGVKVVKLPRAINGADMLTHGCSIEDLQGHLQRLHQRLPKETS